MNQNDFPVLPTPPAPRTSKDDASSSQAPSSLPSPAAPHGKRSAPLPGAGKNQTPPTADNGDIGSGKSNPKQAPETASPDLSGSVDANRGDTTVKEEEPDGRQPAHGGRKPTGATSAKHAGSSDNVPRRTGTAELKRPVPPGKTELDTEVQDAALVNFLLPELEKGIGSKPDSKGVQHLKRRSAGPHSGVADEEEGTATPSPIDNGERSQRPVIVAHVAKHELRPPTLKKPNILPAVKPKSRSECEQRCGTDGFCDPSDPLGCGGVHCGNHSDPLY